MQWSDFHADLVTTGFGSQLGCTLVTYVCWTKHFGASLHIPKAMEEKGMMGLMQIFRSDSEHSKDWVSGERGRCN